MKGTLGALAMAAYVQALLLGIIRDPATQHQHADCADDCADDLTGKTVGIHSFGIEEITIKGKKYTFIGENHLICVE